MVKLKKTSHAPLTDEALTVIAERFRVLSEPTRLKLINALKDGEKNVNDLVRLTGLAQANASRQLKILAQAGILARRPAGVSVFYSIADPAIFVLCEQVCGSLAGEFARLGLRPTKQMPAPASRSGR